MDSPSNNMYDTFKDEIWKELGALDPNWFDVLTAQGCTNEETFYDQDGNFKTVLEKPAADSQLFSTPKVFRHCRVVSPENDQSFTVPQEKEALPQTATSPCLFGVSEEGTRMSKLYGGMPPQSPDGFDLYHAPQKSPVSFAKHISESLGAQIHPDLSWTSSLNTPPPVSSTLILSKTDESPCPVSLRAEQNVFFVRKLFPSLSNGSRVPVVSPKNGYLPTLEQADGDPVEKLQSSPHQSDRVWRQTVPAAIKDSDIKSAVTSVLDGTEDVLSIFFSNTISPLRKVKADRNKRRPSILTKGDGCSATNMLTASNVSPSQQNTIDQKPGVPASPQLISPGKTEDIEITQWSPMSLSDIAHCTLNTAFHNNCSAKEGEDKVPPEQLGNSFESTLQGRPSVKNTDLKFAKKRRKFVYTVGNVKSQALSQKTDSPPRIHVSEPELIPKQSEKALDEVDCYSDDKKMLDDNNEIKKLGNLTEEILLPSVQDKGQDVDMSQLCRAFAQDLSQMLDTGKLSNATEHGPRSGFSPFACLSALKQAKQNSSQMLANFGSGCNTVSKGTSISPAKPSNPIIQSSKSDSGFQSAALDSGHMPASSALYPSSESHQSADFKIDTHRTTPFKVVITEKDNAQLGDSFQGTETKANFPTLDQEKEMLSLRIKSGVNADSISLQLNGTGEGHPSTVKCFPPSDQICDRVLQKTPHSFPSVKASGFRMDSNINTKVSLANLKRARHLFEENEGENLSEDQVTKCMHETKAKISTVLGSGKNKNSNRPTCSAKKPEDYLTASQKADVTELCSLLEEADTQFEFTQFKATKPNQCCEGNATSPQEADKELDPDFLLGIDFDDSFEINAEKHFEKAIPPDKMASISHRECNNEPLITLNKARSPSESNAVKNENSSTEDVHPSSKHSPECSSRTALKEPINLDRAGYTATNKPENKNPSVFGLGFKTAGGNDLRVSKMGLSKAMALFADLENPMTVPETGDRNDVTKYAQDQKSPDQQSLETVAHNELQQSVDKNTGKILCSKKDDCNFNGSSLERGPVCFSNLTDKHSPGCTNDERAMDLLETSKMLSNASQMGFQTASGKGISVSAKAMQEANTFFKDSDLKYSGAGMSVMPRVGDKKNLLTYANVQHEKVNNSEESLQGSIVREHVDIGSGTAHEKMQHQDDAEVPSVAYKHTMALTNASFHINQSSTPKPLSSSLCTSNIGEKSSCGFSTASGKKVYVSANAMTKAKSLLNESNMTEASDSHLKEVDDTSRASHPTSLIQASPQQNAGFQTASGKGVSISSAALKKAKSLLSECDVEDKDEETQHSNVLYPPPRKSGFFTAIGNPVTCSAKAIQKAKAVFSDITVIPDISDTKANAECKEGQKGAPKIHCSFTTAGGTKVEVSQKSLLKAKHLLKELADGESPDSTCISSLYSTSSFGTYKSDLSKIDILKSTSNSNFSKANQHDLPGVGVSPQAVVSCSERRGSSEIVGSSSQCNLEMVNDRSDPDLENISKDSLKFKDCTVTTSGIKCSMFGCEINQCSTGAHNVPNTEESAILNLQSRNLRDCMDTQQEALDCTKAFLEDDVQIGKSLSMILENVPLQDKTKASKSSGEAQKGAGKRSVEDAAMSSQPPLKRRLLEDFGRAVDCPVGPTVVPERMYPDGMMKDRSVFQYSSLLQPNMARPPADVKNSIDGQWQMRTPHFTPGGGRSLHSKMTVFVPPFPRNTKREAHKSAVHRDSTTTTFVPPFKKVRTILHERYSSKPEEPAQANTFVPLTSKTLSRTEVTGTMSTEDSRTSSLVESGSDKHLNSQNLLVDCEVEALTTGTTEVEDKPEGQDLVQNLQNINLARDMQEMRIRKKKRQTIRPVPGSVFLTKMSGVSRISLKFAVNGQNPTRYTPKELHCYGVPQHVTEITGETAESYRFSLQHFFGPEAFIAEGGVQLADGGCLIPSSDGTAGKEEFYRALCDTPGVDPKLISEEWMNNHYRWIVWKRASMERSFPEIMGSLCLTPEQVLLQLKYRYDVEVDHSRRSALRKIMERDDTAAKTLVLCVCGVVSRGHSPATQNENNIKTAQGPIAVVWMTDGWYSIKVQLDGPLTALLQTDRLTVGDKLIINGAQLVGSQDACSPLEAPDTLMLKICANSSRPVRWDTKLGFYRDPRPFLLPLSSLYSNGGPVGCVDIVILRSYPMQWMEKKTDGGVVFRSARAEEREERRYNSHKQKAMETLFAKIQAEFEDEEKGINKAQGGRRTLSRQDMASLQDGEELHEAVGDDPAYLEANLSEKQLQTLRSYRRSLVEKTQSDMQERYRRAVENAEGNEEGCPKRDVSPVWRLCIADSMEQLGSFYQLNFWRPSLDLQSLLREGCRYKIYNLTTSDGKKRSGNTRVQLTATKKTQFQEKQVSQEWLSSRFQPRASVSFVDLQNPEFQPLCGEVDLVGYVITIIDEHGSSPAFYLVDGKQNFVKVRCFSGFAQSGLEDIVKPLVLLALSNLQLRTHCSSTIPVVFAGDLTMFSTNPKEIHLQETLGKLRNMIQGQDKYFLAAEEKLSHLIQADGLSFTSPALQPTTPGHKVDRRRDTPASITSCQPVRSLGSFTPVTRNLPPINCSAEKDPRSLKRKRALDYLSRIPSPPPLTHLGSVTSPSMNKTFNPPRRSGTPGTLKTAQTPARKPDTSPVEVESVGDEELAMIDTQAFHVGELL